MSILAILYASWQCQSCKPDPTTSLTQHIRFKGWPQVRPWLAYSLVLTRLKLMGPDPSCHSWQPNISNLIFLIYISNGSNGLKVKWSAWSANNPKLVPNPRTSSSNLLYLLLSLLLLHPLPLLFHLTSPFLLLAPLSILQSQHIHGTWLSSSLHCSPLLLATLVSFPPSKNSNDA